MYLSEKVGLGSVLRAACFDQTSSHDLAGAGAGAGVVANDLAAAARAHGQHSQA